MNIHEEAAYWKKQSAIYHNKMIDLKMVLEEIRDQHIPDSYHETKALINNAIKQAIKYKQ